MNVSRAVERVARRDPSRAALRFEGRTYAYAELDGMAARVARVLWAQGVRRGDRVALLLGNGPDFVAAYLGALKLGAVAVSLSPAWAGEQAARALADAEPRVLVSDCELYTRLGDARPDTPLSVLLVDGSAPGAHALAPVLAGADGPAPALRTWRDEPAALLYSSGTTGEPRGVVLSHGNVGGCARAKVRYCGIRSGDGLSLFVPLAHCYGQNAVMNAAFAAGACVVLHRRFHPDDVARSVASDGLTMLFGVPPAFRRLLDAGAAGALAGVRYAFSAAATLPVPLAEAWRDAVGVPVHEGYGLTETSPFATYNHRTGHRPGTVGTPIDGVRVRLADPATGEPVEPDAPGEVQVSGPNVMLGYWRRPDETRRALVDGWLRTGDVGRWDEAGHLVLVDRIKDVVNVAGYQVWPADVDRVLHQHPAVAEAAAYGAPDARDGERVEAAVVLRPGALVPAEALLAHCRPRLAGYQVPRHVHVVASLPRNAAGKIVRRLLREP